MSRNHPTISNTCVGSLKIAPVFLLFSSFLVKGVKTHQLYWGAHPRGHFISSFLLRTWLYPSAGKLVTWEKSFKLSIIGYLSITVLTFPIDTDLYNVNSIWKGWNRYTLMSLSWGMILSVGVSWKTETVHSSLPVSPFSCLQFHSGQSSYSMLIAIQRSLTTSVSRTISTTLPFSSFRLTFITFQLILRVFA